MHVKRLDFLKKNSLETLERVIEKGLKEHDFLRGHESYKTRGDTFTRENLDIRTIKRKTVPIVYDWLSHARKTISYIL